jgi:transcriptional regulator PpsR
VRVRRSAELLVQPADPGERALLFQRADEWLPEIDEEARAAALSAAGDVALVIDSGGVIIDAAVSGQNLPEVAKWVGQSWIDTVTPESRDKVEQMLATPVRQPRWRQVNHAGSQRDVPVRYMAFDIGSGRTLAIGREESSTARLQQRLIQVQQSLERDYLRLRQAESRYRLLFEMSAEPMIIVEAASFRVREINPAAARLLAGSNSGVIGHTVVAQVAAEDRDRLVAFFGAAAVRRDTAPLAVTLAKGGEQAEISARAFRQGGTSYFLLQLQLNTGAPAPEDRMTLDVMERMPDAFALVDEDLNVVAINAAFAEMVEAPSIERLRGTPIGNYVGRPGIDLALILAQLAEHQVARNVPTILRGLDGRQEEVEISAVRTDGPQPHYGFSIRVVARRLRDLPPATRDLPRSVEQLTELVGRMPLKDIVRESTDLIEQLCIEAALEYTSNNRASAAEVLGLSRQSLYSKLHRHGFGRFGEEASAE